ncbi:MAG: hypothetical protein IJJ25_01435 [Lachnospiraceae bacterium]|nr:hypothetical protein [Lachnospiraceae bacterium]
MKTRFKTIIKTAVFFLFLLLLFFSIQKTVSSPSDPRNYQLIRGFYAEPENSLDAVFIGGSNAYAFYQPPVLWAAEGIKTASYSCNGNRISAAKYYMEEIRKKQKDPLFIIVMNEYNLDIKENKIHFHTDYVPFSVNKIHLIEALCDNAGIHGTDRLEYYFPIIRYHSRWKELTKDDFHYALDGLKGGSHYDKFLHAAEDQGTGFTVTEERGDIPEDTLACLKDLMEYCRANDLRVLFIHSPQLVSEKQLKVYNAVDDLLNSSGFDTLNLCSCADEIGLDCRSDFYNKLHNNIHGSLKVSKFLARYLKENYSLGSSRRDDAAWNSAWTKYHKIISEAVTKDELVGLEDS